MYFHSCVIHSSKDTTRYTAARIRYLCIPKHCLYVCLNLVLALFLCSKQNVKKKHFKCTTTIDGWCHIYSNCSGVFIPIKTHYGNDFILATRKPKTYIDTGEREIEIERELSISRSRSLTSDLRFLFSTIYFAIETITSHHLRAAKKELVRFFYYYLELKRSYTAVIALIAAMYDENFNSAILISSIFLLKYAQFYHDYQIL